MYSDWASLYPVLINNIDGQEGSSVLEKLSGGAGKDVALAVVKQLAGNLGIAQAAEPSSLTNDQEVQWCMEVICFGLSLPLSEHDTIRDCVNIYCEWLTALHPTPRISVPKPICKDSNIYARKIIKHLHNLFVPRQGEGSDVINRQAVLCHRVLRTLQNTAQLSTDLTRETWEALLLFLLAINEILLAPPTIKDDVGDQLCERVLSVLFEVWLLACVRCFPSPSLWKTLQESCMHWRHRVALIEQWNRINLALTARLLEFTYGSTFPELKVLDEDAQLIPAGMSNDCVAQSWFRFLHILGSPAALCKPREIANTPRFHAFTMANDAVITESCQHSCLKVLPAIFLKAVKGIAGQVDAFLGIAQISNWEDVELRRSSGSGLYQSSGSTVTSIGPTGSSINGLGSGSNGGGSGGVTSEGRLSSGSVHHNPTPPAQRRLAKSFSVASSQSKGLQKTSLIGLTSSRTPNVPTASAPSSGPSSTSSITSVMSLGHEPRAQLAAGRPRCNSILHLFGEWLFEAAHQGSETWYLNNKKQASEVSKRPSSMMVDSRKGNISLSQPSSMVGVMDLPSYLTIDKYESGRAEAIGALSRIFCAKKTGEEILPVYLARYYLALQQGLIVTDIKECGETMASILLNSSDLFRLDLDGVQILVPAFITALEIVLPVKDLNLRSTCFNKVELRRSSIHLLLSMLVLPLHFQNLPIRNLFGTNDKLITFGALKPCLMNLLVNALQVEWDGQNAHMLLGGLLLCVQDSAAAECADGNFSRDAYDQRNLLSSACSDSACSTGSASSSAIQVTNEYQSFTGSEEYSGDLEPTNDSAHALFVRAIYLVCHRLISTWKTDLHISLAALELLTGLARIHIRESEALECKRAVKWICDFVSSQCSRPPPAHSKDLHSGIVAAYHCLAVWLVEHPALLSDRDCLQTVMEVVELGISGSKSVGKTGEPTKMKDEKELKPVSMRVRDAAENLLTVILEQVGYFPSLCGAQSSSSLLDECALLRQCNSWKEGSGINARESAVRSFRYFVVENTTLLALLEEPLGNDQDPQPTVTALARVPSGRHAWSMQLRHLPRSKSGSKAGAVNPGRPVPMSEAPAAREPERHYFPEAVDRVPPCAADESIPALETLACHADPATAAVRAVLVSQIAQEKRCWQASAASEQALSRASECKQPKPQHDFQTARLFLAHFGFLDPRDDEENQEQSGSVSASLVCLDNSAPGFLADLQQLDAMSPRTCDTVHVFYVRSGQRIARDIAANADNASLVSSHYLEALRSLGWPVRVSDHSGWTGHASTSWRTKQDRKQYQESTNINRDHGGALYNGEEQIMYWADASSEIAFVVATNSQLYGDLPSSVTGTEQSPSLGERSISDASPAAQQRAQQAKGRTHSLDSDPVPPQRRRTGGIKPTQQSATKMLLIWLESYEDHLTAPIDNLLAYTGTALETGPPPKSQDALVIFLHALDSGLLRVHLQGPVSRMSTATPLVDGMVVSRRALGPLVRQTALNMARRRRLDNDSYQPPHVRRRLKVQEIVQKYRKEMSHPELLAHLFQHPSA